MGDEQRPITFQDILVEGETWECDLQKLIGKRIKTVTGHLTREFGGVSFSLMSIVFEDGTKLSVEGEHDFPYVTEYRRQPQPNFDEETLERLYQETGEEED